MARFTRESKLSNVPKKTHIVKERPFKDAENYEGCHEGFKGVATSSQSTTPIDTKVTEDKYIEFFDFILKDQTFDDTLTVKIIDKDNVLGNGTNYVLYKWGENWNIISDRQEQKRVNTKYITKIPKNTYLCVDYTSTGSSDVQVKLNVGWNKKIN